jgi:hypothetical protein
VFFLQPPAVARRPYLQPLPADRSDFDVHGAFEDDKMKTKIKLSIICTVHYIICIITFVFIIAIKLIHNF